MLLKLLQRFPSHLLKKKSMRYRHSGCYVFFRKGKLYQKWLMPLK